MSDLDDSYETILTLNRAHVRTEALRHLRSAPDDRAVLVELPDGSAIVAEALEGFVAVDAARVALQRFAADPATRVFLVLRPDEDLSRPGRPTVTVEWIDEGRARSASLGP